MYTIPFTWSSYQKRFNLVSNSEFHCTMNHLFACVPEISMLRLHLQTQGFNWYWGMPWVSGSLKAPQGDSNVQQSLGTTGLNNKKNQSHNPDFGTFYKKLDWTLQKMPKKNK